MEEGGFHVVYHVYDKTNSSVKKKATLRLKLHPSIYSSHFHPLKQFCPRDFVERKPGVPQPAMSIVDTPFKLVETIKDLEIMCRHLQIVEEFAVDLERNKDRCSRGRTCLILISTRGEDYVVDSLKLHSHIEEHMKSIFMDPAKKKVMHGAARNIARLQREFDIYVCNLFDTEEAARVLKMERYYDKNVHFCEMVPNGPNEVYEHANWRKRPLPLEMIRYARENTHYLLHVFDCMSSKLSEHDDLLLQVYERSYEACLQLRKKRWMMNTMKKVVKKVFSPRPDPPRVLTYIPIKCS